MPPYFHLLAYRFIDVKFSYSFRFQVELKFRSGDIMYVYGEMDEDGFYTVNHYLDPLYVPAVFGFLSN